VPPAAGTTTITSILGLVTVGNGSNVKRAVSDDVSFLQTPRKVEATLIFPPKGILHSFQEPNRIALEKAERHDRAFLKRFP
jgi:hypothetical protein